MEGRAFAGGGQPLRATVLYPGDSDRQRCERELLERGVPLPLTHRIAWSGVDPATATWFIAVREPTGACTYGAGVQVTRSRALPGHLLMRVERLDPAVDPGACVVALRALADLARRRWPRVLRAYVELYSREPGARAGVAGRLAELGFRRRERGRMYRHTAVLDLSGDEEAIFSKLHRSARRNVREAAKAGLEIRAIADPALGHRVDALLREAFARTGGTLPVVTWESVIELSSRQPDLSRLIGLFRTDVAGPESLLAFEWACMHGDNAQSVAAGATRAATGRMPLAYALMWDVIRWARARGARYVDLGGITLGTGGSADPLGGISDFKRSFGATVVEVGEEWQLEPHPFAARMATALGRGAAALGRLRRLH
ncbi:MAG: peptidoglycan bridge formation glycyltransferase FemA/FemB family protein [Gemmatimonadaceae bacterium]